MRTTGGCLALTPRPRAAYRVVEISVMREGTMVSMQAGKTGTLRGLAFATLLLAGGAPMAQQGATDIARLEKLKSSVVEGVESRRKLSQVMNDTVFSFGELGIPGARDLELPHRRAGEERLHHRARHCRHADRVGRELGLGPAGHRARQRHRRHPEGIRRSPALPSASRWSKARPAMVRATTPARP